MDRETVRRGTLAVALATVALGGAAPVAAAAPPGPPPGILDHFTCYQAKQPTTAPPIPGSVQLLDQFDTTGKPRTVVVGKPVQLCNPVVKIVNGTRTPVGHKTLHLVCFAIKQRQPDPTFTVLVSNQFDPPAGGGRKVLTGGAPVQLCLPSWKGLTAPPTAGEALANLDHFKCYRARDLTDPAAGGVPASVGLLDQFTSAPKKAGVGKIVMLCNPVAKIIPGAVFKPQHPDLHLVCWAVRNPIKTPQRVFVANQFGKRALAVGPVGTPRTLCVPSFKRIV